MDEDFKITKRAEISAEHQGPGSVRKVLIDDFGSHEWSKFVRLEIARNGTDGGFYLFHIAADGSGTDTWHDTIEQALDEAEAEYRVSGEDWQDIA
jgi:hypothetical protein